MMAELTYEHNKKLLSKHKIYSAKVFTSTKNLSSQQ